ncbi:hypothetical protein [Prevotella koreensis]|uniref:hypothetical protein n=1 Tax=Prevotella koreensis TaxID=2490854 RepID=UPI0028F09898|nr:hypothetical protein [Prevotella koreensis]
MQIKCPHCRFKYSEALKSGTTEVLSICPRCGHSFSFEVTEDDIRREQTPPQVSVSSSAVPPMPQAAVPEVPEFMPSQSDTPELPHNSSPVNTPPSAPSAFEQSKMQTEDENKQSSYSNITPDHQPSRHNYSPQSNGGSSRRLSAFVLFIIITTIGLGFIYGMSKIFGKDENDIPEDSIANVTEPSTMTISTTGNSTFRFEGYIIGLKKRLPIVMNLTKRGSKIDGNYYYVLRGSHTQLTLHGIVEENGVVTMSEYNVEGDHTGDFYGTLYSDGTFSGTFKSYNRKKFKFELSTH